VAELQAARGKANLLFGTSRRTGFSSAVGHDRDISFDVSTLRASVAPAMGAVKSCRWDRRREKRQVSTLGRITESISGDRPKFDRAEGRALPRDGVRLMSLERDESTVPGRVGRSERLRELATGCGIVAQKAEAVATLIGMAVTYSCS
jgi:hypothetical protein